MQPFLPTISLIALAALHGYATVVSPESQGVPSRAIMRWVREMDKTGGFHGFVLMRHGQTIAEGWWSPYSADRRHNLYSFSKSVLSTAVGMLVDEGRIDLDERVTDIFADRLPANPSANLKAMRVRDLLGMASGHGADAEQAFRDEPDADWIGAFLACPVPHQPGRQFLYESGASYMLSALVHCRAGQLPSEYLRGRLFDPLGIGEVHWSRSPEGEEMGGWGLSLTTREMALFGQFWLQRGEWQGRQLLSRDYVAQASSAQTPNRAHAHPRDGEDWRVGYGFHFWKCRHGCYRAAGAYGQLAVIMPEQDAVLAVNSKAPMSSTLDRLWELLPEMAAAPLPEDRAAADELARFTAALSLPIVAGEATGVVEKLGTVFSDGSGTAVSLTPDGEGWALAVTNAAWCGRIPVGFGRWRTGEIQCTKRTELAHYLPGLQPVAASGAWIAPRTFTARLWFVEMPHDAQAVLDFTDGRLKLKVSSSARNIACVGELADELY